MVGKGGFGPTFGAAMLEAVGPHFAGFSGGDLFFSEQAAVAADCSVDGGEDGGFAVDLELVVFNAVGQGVGCGHRVGCV